MSVSRPCEVINFSKMNSKIQILLTITAAASSSFLQTPSNQLESTFNSTFLSKNERLFKPIIIPNITQFSETQKTKPIEEESKTTGNPLKFSSRYSTKQNDVSKEKTNEDATEFPTEAESSKNEQIPQIISDRSDNLDEEEDKKESDEYSEESEESDVDPTIEPPHSTFYKKYKDSEISTTEDSSEEKEEEDKRSVDDYYNSGSKNYHSIQTPLSKIKYQGLHSYREDRKRIVPPIARHPSSHKWPYSKSQLKAELENLNEISESDENYEKELDEGISEEVKKIPKQLEIAEEKDREKFDRTKKYNYIELRNKKIQQQKALIAQEEKDEQKPLFLKQYQVDEEESTHQTKEKPVFGFKNENIWPTVTTPKTSLRLKTYPVFTKPTSGHQFLGPVVFNQNLHHRTKPKDSTRNIFQKGLIENEKLDQENLNNHRFSKSVLRTGSKETQSFNHLKESDEMYNAILANIQSVFGLRTQPLKSGTRNQKGSIPEVNLDESKAFTWSVPLIKDKQ